MLFGAHVSAAGGISTAIDRAEALGCDAVQVFTQSPRMWRPTAHDPEQVARFRARREEAGIRGVACHALYLVNLASADDAILAKSIAALRATLETAAAIGAEAVVFHVGSHLGGGFEQVVERVVPPLRGLLELTTDELWLCLENCAGTGGTIGRSLDELATLHDALDRHPRLGICLDSCHWWASGVDVTDAAALDAAVRELDDRIGLDRLRCLHVNDSKTPLGSNRDRHDSVGKGLMGAGLGTFLAHPAFQGLPALLETPGPVGHGPDAAEMKRFRRLHAQATGGSGDTRTSHSRRGGKAKAQPRPPATEKEATGKRAGGRAADSPAEAGGPSSGSGSGSRARAKSGSGSGSGPGSSPLAKSGSSTGSQVSAKRGSRSGSSTSAGRESDSGSSASAKGGSGSDPSASARRGSGSGSSAPAKSGSRSGSDSDSDSGSDRGEE